MVVWLLCFFTQGRKFTFKLPQMVSFTSRRLSKKESTPVSERERERCFCEFLKWKVLRLNTQVVMSKGSLVLLLHLPLELNTMINKVNHQSKHKPSKT